MKKSNPEAADRAEYHPGSAEGPMDEKRVEIFGKDT